MTQVIISFPLLREKLFYSENKEKYTGSLHDQILHIWDVIDECTLLRIFETYGFPKYLACDSLSYFQSSKIDFPIYTADVWLEAELTHFEKSLVRACPQQLQTKHTANFQINKKQINRFLAMKFCEIFDIDVDYTWSGIGNSFDLTYIVNEQNKIKDPIINQFWGDILSPIARFEQKWILTNNKNPVGTYVIANYGGNVDVWNNGLNKVISNTAISLITESISTQKAITFTEKTAYSVAGLTFPIWVGGYNAATEWKNKGFDTFEDIIDHSYERMPTLIERCFYAFYLNKGILSDVNMAAQLRQQHIERLVNNQKKLTFETLNKYNEKIIKTWPINLQKPIITSFRRHLCFINK